MYWKILCNIQKRIRFKKCNYWQKVFSFSICCVRRYWDDIRKIVFSIAWPRKKFARERKIIAFPRNLCVPTQTFCVGTQYFTRPRNLCVASQRIKMALWGNAKIGGNAKTLREKRKSIVPSQSLRSLANFLRCFANFLRCFANFLRTLANFCVP